MAVLVTGCAGFIGSNFVHYYLSRHKDADIVGLDKLTYAGDLENMATLSPGAKKRFSFHKGDICDRALLRELFKAERIGAVINFAAESHVDRSIADCSPFIATNVGGTHELLEAARECGVPRFIQISTDEVYGSLGPSDQPFTEESPLAPNSPYAASKAAADLLCRAYHRTYGMPVIVTRSCNNYGPRQFPEKLIPRMIANALKDKPLPVYGDGRSVRDWLHVEDHCAALDLIMEKGGLGEVYNIGADSELENLDLVRRILLILNKPESLISFVKDRPGHDRRYAINAGKLKRELGWHGGRTIEEALVGTVEWYRTQISSIRNRTKND